MDACLRLGVGRLCSESVAVSAGEFLRPAGPTWKEGPALGAAVAMPAPVQEPDLKEYRCAVCGQKLGLLTTPFEIKCRRCKAL